MSIEGDLDPRPFTYENRAYPENTNFETFVPRSFKFHTFGDLLIAKKC